VVPAKDFDTSQRFYVELGFEARRLADRLVEMRLGVFSFILQDHYVREWADNFVIQLTVSDVRLWVGSHRQSRPSRALQRQDQVASGGGLGHGGGPNRSFGRSVEDRRALPIRRLIFLRPSAPHIEDVQHRTLWCRCSSASGNGRV
jgi:hypothetical protein